MPPQGVSATAFPEDRAPRAARARHELPQGCGDGPAHEGQRCGVLCRWWHCVVRLVTSAALTVAGVNGVAMSQGGLPTTLDGSGLVPQAARPGTRGWVVSPTTPASQLLAVPLSHHGKDYEVRYNSSAHVERRFYLLQRLTPNAI